jgi:quercetin dioxygenase-like cupin family protein
MRTLLGLLATAIVADLAQEATPPRGLTAVQAPDIEWRKAEDLPAGVMVAHVSGDAKGGAAVDFIKFPAGARVPLHWHGANHVVTVLSGKLLIGAPGLDKDLEVGPGGYFKIAGQTPHVTSAKEETVIAVSGDAPHDLHWARRPD